MFGFNIPVALPGFEGQSVVVRIPGLFSAPQLLVGGRPDPRGARRDAYLLRAPDGTTKTVRLARRLLDPVGRLECDGVTVPVAHPFGWAALDLTNDLQHRCTATFCQAALCAEATTSVINLIAIVSGQRAPAQGDGRVERH